MDDDGRTSDRLFELQKSGKMASYSLGWFRWVCDTFEICYFEEWNDEYVARSREWCTRATY